MQEELEGREDDLGGGGREEGSVAVVAVAGIPFCNIFRISRVVGAMLCEETPGTIQVSRSRYSMPECLHSFCEETSRI